MGEKGLAVRWKDPWARRSFPELLGEKDILGCSIRMGLILEDVDGFAGDIAHRHAADDSSRNVTASVDKITWLQSPPEGRSCCLK